MRGSFLRRCAVRSASLARRAERLDKSMPIEHEAGADRADAKAHLAANRPLPRTGIIAWWTRRRKLRAADARQRTAVRRVHKLRPTRPVYTISVFRRLGRRAPGRPFPQPKPSAAPPIARHPKHEVELPAPSCCSLWTKRIRSRRILHPSKRALRTSHLLLFDCISAGRKPSRMTERRSAVESIYHAALHARARRTRMEPLMHRIATFLRLFISADRLFPALAETRR